MKIKNLLVGLLLLPLVACSGGADTSATTSTSGSTTLETVRLKVWGSQEDQIVLGTILDEFKAANPDKKYIFEIGVVSESEAQTTLQEDPTSGADIFSFAGDHILSLANNGLLLEISQAVKDYLLERNSASSVSAGEIGGKQYGIPLTADNGYFMYYDKRVAGIEDAIGSWDSLTTFAQTKSKNVYMDLSNGFYAPSFFFGTGGHIGLAPDGTQTSDFNNANGLIAGKAAWKAASTGRIIAGNDAVLTSDFGKDFIAGVTGLWNKNALANAVGGIQNLGAHVLPSFTSGGTTYNTSTFAGFKLVGVNKNSAKPAEALKVALFIAGERGQELRFQERGYAPTNLVIANSAAVQADPFISVLAEQLQYGHPQKEIKGTFWDPMAAFGTYILNNPLPGESVIDAAVQAQLDILIEGICK
jgi:arabinogalactan oligomer/maltooligosaccharide transport system substrate-binding protein